MVQETNKSNERYNTLKLVLIAGIATLAICIVCAILSVGSMTYPLIAGIMAPTRTPFPVTSEFAQQVMVIQQDEDRPVQLNFPRYLDTDQNGNIYVGNAGDGNIIIFDRSGNYLQSIPVLSEGSTMNGLAVTSEGTIYLSADGIIRRIDTHGTDKTLPIDSTIAGSVSELIMNRDNSLLATNKAGDILRIELDGTVKVIASKPFKKYLDETEHWIGITVDKSGNIYAVGGSTCVVLKFSPDGEYLSQFGGENRNHVVRDLNDPPGGFPSMDPGYFYEPMAIAVDRYERVIVSDSTYNVQVFDSNGQYIDSFATPNIIRWTIFDYDNNLYMSSDEPEVIKLDVRNP